MTPKKKVIFLATAVIAVYFFHPSAWHPTRYGQLKCMINRHAGHMHMTRGMNSFTIQALRAAVTDEDIPVLISMIDDKDRVSQMTAAQTLARMGPLGRAALEQDLGKMGPKWHQGDDFYKRQSIEEALSEKQQ